MATNNIYTPTPSPDNSGQAGPAGVFSQAPVGDGNVAQDQNGAAPAAPTIRQSNPPSVTDRVDPVVSLYYPDLLPSVHAALAVAGAMALDGRTKPTSLLFEAGSGSGKTAVLQMLFPVDENSDLNRFVYRSDKFTPKAFVSHAANVRPSQLKSVDLLPRLANKILVTKELAPLFRGRTEEMEENFSMLISVLDGRGFTSDSGIRGQRGYQKRVLFNWIGATTPLPRATHRMMSQLGTRLLFYEVPAIVPTEEELLAYAERDNARKAEYACQLAVNNFLLAFYKSRVIATVSPERVVIPKEISSQLVRWAQLLVRGRAEVRYEKVEDWNPVAALQPEAPWKVIDYFKQLIRGHALIHGREEVNNADLDLVAHVAISSIPIHLRPIVRELQRSRRRGRPNSAV